MPSSTTAKNSLVSKVATLAEILLVLGIGFGIFIYGSTRTLLSRSSDPDAAEYSGADFIFIVFYELFALGLIALLLRYRGWRLHDLNLQFSPVHIAVALLLVLLRQLLAYPLVQLCSALGLPVASAVFHAGIIPVAAIVLINSVYEEVLLSGYLFKRLEQWHPALILLFSFLLRASFHTYQGWGMLPSVLSLSLVFGMYYLRYKKLWPLILAHAFGNMFSFLALRYGLLFP